MDGTASSRRISHALKLLSSLEELKDRKITCDFEIKVGESSFALHSAVLMSFSNYFEDMFSRDEEESRQGYIELNDLNPDAVGTCIGFMYMGNMKMVLSEMPSVLEASHFMKIEDLTDLCLQHLRENLSGVNCLRAMRLFGRYSSNRGDERLAQSCAIKNLGTVMETEDFLHISCKDLRRYAREANIAPDVLWKGIVKWLKCNVNEREQNLPEIVDDVLKKDGVTLEFVIKIIWKHPFVKKSNAAKLKILDAIIEDDLATEKSINLELSFDMKRIFTLNSVANGNRIESVVDKYLATNFAEAVKYERFYQLSFKDLNTILQSEHLKCEVETMKWEAILKWVKTDQTREEQLPYLMKLINFKAMPIVYIQKIKTEEVIQRSKKCMEMLLDVILSENSDSNNRKAFTTKQNVPESCALLALDTKSGIISALDLSEKNQLEITKVEKKKFCSIVSAQRNLYVLLDETIFQYSSTGIWKTLLKWNLEPTEKSQAVVCRDNIYLIEKIVVSCYDPLHNVLRQPESGKGCGLEEGFCVAASPDSIFALGGDGSWKAARRLDPGSNKWIDLGPMRDGRCHASAAVHRGRLYVMGGISVMRLAHRSVECYDQSKNSWTFLRNMNRSREWCSAVTYKDKLYAVGGACWMNQRQKSNSVEVYDADSHKWKNVCDMKTQADRVVACAWKGVDVESLLPVGVKDN